ncbi:hypothetical protein SESBI_50470 [Sesbania bispinosa]|nr:hypothetical protein SESBI_50470 [Sesbania bispinosa]
MGVVWVALDADLGAGAVEVVLDREIWFGQREENKEENKGVCLLRKKRTVFCLHSYRSPQPPATTTHGCRRPLLGRPSSSVLISLSPPSSFLTHGGRPSSSVSSIFRVVPLPVAPPVSFILLCTAPPLQLPATTDPSTSSKCAPQGYYKGKNCKPTGFHTRKGDSISSPAHDGLYRAIETYLKVSCS